MKAILTSPFNAITDRATSHRSAQAEIYADLLRQQGVDVTVNYGNKIRDFSDYEAMYVYHGNDWSGSLNLFGGMKGYGGVDNIVAFSKYRGSVFSLGIPFPDYKGLIAPRIEQCVKENREMLPSWLDVDLGRLAALLVCPVVLNSATSTCTRMVVGDSHAISMYRPGWWVNSIPFKTLNGILIEGIHGPVMNSLRSQDLSGLSELEFYFGNIDIRHHLCRISDDHIGNTRALIKRYVEAVESLPVESVSIYEPLPIENESRKLPKTGYYKGKPFWGTWAQRNECREIFCDEVVLLAKRAKLIRWADYLKNDKGELDFSHMEKPQSVHLARSSYPHWQGPKMAVAESREVQRDARISRAAKAEAEAIQVSRANHTASLSDFID